MFVCTFSPSSPRERIYDRPLTPSTAAGYVATATDSSPHSRDSNPEVPISSGATTTTIRNTRRQHCPRRIVFVVAVLQASTCLGYRDVRLQRMRRAISVRPLHLHRASHLRGKPPATASGRRRDIETRRENPRNHARTVTRTRDAGAPRALPIWPARRASPRRGRSRGVPQREIRRGEVQRQCEAPSLATAAPRQRGSPPVHRRRQSLLYDAPVAPTRRATKRTRRVENAQER